MSASPSSIAKSGSSDQQKATASYETKEAGEKLTLDYYLMASRLNLIKTSRTAKDGVIDISAASHIELRICRDTIGLYSDKEIKELEESNGKAKNLDLISLKEMSTEDIRRTTVANFEKIIKGLYKTDSSKIRNAIVIRRIIERIAKGVGAKIVKEEKWLRTHDSRKLPYTESKKLDEELTFFCEKFFEKLQELQRLTEPSAKIEWAEKTAAWVEYRINLTDHFMTDSCGKVAAIVSTWVCMLANHRLPVFLNKKEYLQCAPRKRAKSNKEMDPDTDKQYQRWERHYRSKFPVKQEDIKRLLETLEVKDSGETRKRSYRINALEGLMAISKTSKEGKIGTSGHSRKEYVVLQPQDIEAASFSVATFSSLVDMFFDEDPIKSEVPVNQEYLRALIKKILIRINQNTLQAIPPQDSGIEGFFIENGGDLDKSHPYTSVSKLKDAFENCLDEIVERLGKRDCNPIKTVALIHYRFQFQHHFFIDGNHRLAFALVVFSCIKLKIALPRLTEFEEIQRHYITDKVPLKISTDKDAQFLHWYAFYRSLFYNGVKLLETDKIEPFIVDDAWDVTPEELQVLEKDFTIYESGIGIRAVGEIDLMKEATGYGAKDLVVFTPNRMLLHEGIVHIKTKFQLPDNEVGTVEKVNKKLDTLLKELSQDEETQKKVKALNDRFKEIKENFTSYVTHALEDYFHGVRNNTYLHPKLTKFNDSIQKRIKEGECRIRASESRNLMIDLTVDDLLRDFYRKEIKKVVEGYFSGDAGKKIIADNNVLELTTWPNTLRSAWAIAGGPASGKSSSIKLIRAQAEFNDDCCVVNPDEYKYFLTSEGTKKSVAEKYAALVHEESSYITDQLMNRLEAMIEEDKGPNILLDVVTSSSNKMKVIAYGGASLRLFVVTCPVEGEQGAVARAYRRAKEGPPQDRDRYVPTEAILEGHKKECTILPDIIKGFNVSFYLIDSSTRTPSVPKTVAFVDSHDMGLNVYDPILFVNFLKKTNINTKAAFEEQAYLKDMTGKDVANLFLKYMRKGIIITLMYDNDKIVNPEVQKAKALMERKVGKEEDETSEIEELKKKNLLASLGAGRIICRDWDSFVKIFGEGETGKKIAEEFLLTFFSPIEDDNSPIEDGNATVYDLYIYNAQGGCMLRRSPSTKSNIICAPTLESTHPSLYHIAKHSVPSDAIKSAIKDISIQYPTSEGLFKAMSRDRKALCRKYIDSNPNMQVATAPYKFIMFSELVQKTQTALGELFFPTPRTPVIPRKLKSAIEGD